MISVIVPVAEHETMLESCAAELANLPEEFSVTLVSLAQKPQELHRRLKWLRIDKTGRAAAMNHGAAAAEHPWLWFVHADTKLYSGCAQLLLASIEKHPDSLLYFDLDYYDGGFAHRISAGGAALRSRWFGAPFGDQAFCVPARHHELVGGYREDAPYGEDHLYARAMRRNGVKLMPVGATVGTSARNHLAQGWLKIVCKYQWLWIKQALADRRAAP